MHKQAVALVTGANKGIGREIARQLAGHGFTVLVGSRELARGEAVAREIPGARAIQLDVTDARSIAAAAAQVGGELGRLDVLVNNAAVASPPGTPADFAAQLATGTPSTARVADVRALFETNVFGPIATTQAFLPLLREAPAGRIVNVSSRLGSLTAATLPDNPYKAAFGVAYAPSKSALNAVTVAFALELEGTRIKVNACCPGYTRTDLNANTGTKSVAEGARTPVRLALLGADGPTAGFFDDDGVVPW
jgi:NAD(P)-dependent dehydrogenase (short-subunit alcohol dehydrogenase family)